MHQQEVVEGPSSPRCDGLGLPRHVVHLHTGGEWGGGEYQVQHLVQALTDAGMMTSLWASSSGALFNRARGLGLPVRALPGGWRLPLGTRSLTHLLREQGADLIHCHDSGALNLGLRLRRQLGASLVLARRVASPLRRNPVSRAKYSARRIDAVLAISGTVRDVMVRCGFPRDRIFVVPSGVNVSELDALVRDPAFRLEQGAGYLVTGIGRLSPRKNWSFLIRTAAAVQAQGIDVRWLLVGEGPERTRLEAAARSLGVASRVRFLGFRDDAAQILRNCDLLFFPSLREGASVTVRQAMVLGVPVVAVDCPGVMETLGGHGWLVGPDDAAGASRAVIDALTGSSTREGICQAARRVALDRYTLERTVRGTIAVYSSVLSRVRPDQCRS